MQKYFTVKESVEEYARKGKEYPFPPPTLKRCHNPNCNKIVQYKKHGFYRRYLITNTFKDKILIRRYICPVCGHTISYLPQFCLSRFIYGLKYIFTCIYEYFMRKGTLKAYLSKLNAINLGLNISRQLVYHYRKRFIQNLKLIQTGLRQMNPKIKLPDDELSQIERAKMLLVVIKNNLDRNYTFSRKFHDTTNKTFLALCK